MVVAYLIVDLVADLGRAVVEDRSHSCIFLVSLSGYPEFRQLAGGLMAKMLSAGHSGAEILISINLIAHRLHDWLIAQRPHNRVLSHLARVHLAVLVSILFIVYVSLHVDDGLLCCIQYLPRFVSCFRHL